MEQSGFSERLRIEKPEDIPEIEKAKLFYLEKNPREVNPDAKRVMITFDNPGPYNGLVPVISALSADLRCRGIIVLASGWGAQEFSKNTLSSSFEEVGPNTDPKNPTRETVLADILQETTAYEPDIVLVSASAKNGPETVGLFASRTNFGAKRMYYFMDGWGGAPIFYNKTNPNEKSESRIEGVFCNDEIAKRIAMRVIPELPEKRFLVTGSPVIDGLYVEDSETLTEEARRKLEIDPDTTAILFLGDVSGEYTAANGYSGVDSQNFNMRTFERTFESVRAAAQHNSRKKFALMVRPHPRDPRKDELLQRAETMEILPNMQVCIATHPEITMQEARYAADAVAGFISTENFLAPRIGRRAIFLAFREEGLGQKIIDVSYGDRAADIEKTDDLISFVHDPSELQSVLTALSRAPIHVEKPKGNIPAKENILNTIVRL